DPMENRRDGLRFSGFAMMQVRASGGPIHAPHERVLQLLIQPWKGDDESWTIYRHEAGAQEDRVQEVEPQSGPGKISRVGAPRGTKELARHGLRKAVRGACALGQNFGAKTRIA